MLIVINRPNLVGVDGEFYPVSLEGLRSDVQHVDFDTEKRLGSIEYTEDAYTSVTVRDFVKEDEEYRYAISNNKRIDKLEPRYKSVQVRKAPKSIEDFDYAPFYERWLAAQDAHKKQKEQMEARFAKARAEDELRMKGKPNDVNPPGG